MAPLDQRRMRAAEGQRRAGSAPAPKPASPLLDVDGAARDATRGTGSQGLPVEKPAFGSAALPDHRRAAAVAALEVRPEADAVGIAQILEGELGLRQARAPRPGRGRPSRAARQQRRSRTCATASVSPPGLRPARDMAHHVVVGEGPAGPAVGDGLLERLDACRGNARPRIAGRAGRRCSTCAACRRRTV